MNQRRPAAAQTGGQHDVAHVFPQCVASDVGDDDLPLQIDGRRTRTIAHRDRDRLGGARVLDGQARAGAQIQSRARLVEQPQRAHRVGRDALSHFRDRFERDAQIDVGRQALEHASLAGGEQLGALALGDVGDAAADQPMLTRLQSHPAHFAGNVVAERVAEHPFEHRALARKCQLELRAIRVSGQRTVGLLRRAEHLGAARQQHRAIHLEEAHRVLVDVRELVTVQVDDDDDLGRVLDQRSIARLAVAQRGVGSFAIGGVAQADHEQRATIQHRLADRQLGGKVRAVGMQAERLVRREVDLRVVEARGQLFELRGQRLLLGELRQQEAERAAGDLRFRVTEHALPRGVERDDVAGLVDRDDDVLDVIEHRLQLARGALAQLACQVGRLVGHELHRANDAAALVIGARVGAFDGSEQLGEVELAVRP